MTTLRPFRCDDLFRFNNVNLDPLTETYNMQFYMMYFSRWPEYFQVAESPTGKIMGYVMGKSEARNNNPLDWHGHVTAISVGEEHRRLGIAGKLMRFLEDVSERKKCYFVDLFVRVTNKVAVAMYKKMGYVVYRTLTDYYTGTSNNEDAYDMRRALSRDKEKRSERPPTQEELAELDDT